MTTAIGDGAAPAAVPPSWDCHLHVFNADAPVLAGHYRPATRRLAEVEALAAAQGVGHLVLVQPSVYGTDHRVLVAALQASGGRHRGVAVVAPEVSDAELDALHAVGVRGVRFNRVSPVGRSADPAGDLRRLAPRLRARGWHVQWYLPSSGLAELVALQAQTGLVFVLDHLGGLQAGTPDAAADWQALAALAQADAWVKLSGWYRLNAALPYDALHATVQRVAGLCGPRLVWGSDWPHTGLAATALPAYGATWAPVAAALGDAQAEAVRQQQPLSLYR